MQSPETGLATLVDTAISVITNDGRNIVGVLRGYDQATNLILNDCHERVYSTAAGVEQLQLGLYVIRGDNIAVVGEVDEELDQSIDLSQRMGRGDRIMNAPAKTDLIKAMARELLHARGEAPLEMQGCRRMALQGVGGTFIDWNLRSTKHEIETGALLWCLGNDDMMRRPAQLTQLMAARKG